MSRTFPILIFLAATFIGGGGGFLSSSVLRRLVALPDGAEVSAPTVSDGRAVAATKPVGPAKTSDKTYLKGILCRNLFDLEKVGECDFNVAKTSESDSEAKTDLQITLLGTLVASPERFSSALIQEEGIERAIGYSIHDKIHDAEIVGIEKKLVRLRRGDGREEILRMDEDAPSPAKSSTPATRASSGDEEVTKKGENHYEISSETLDKYLTDLEGLSRMGRALLHRGSDGEFDGYRLSAIRRNTIADKLGIRNGDIVHSVNGKPLNSMASAMEAYNTMANEKNFSFEVTRRGQKVEMTYDVQ